MVGFPDDGGRREFAVRVEHRDEAPGYQVEYPFFHVAEALRLYARRDDGMVVGHLAVVEYLLRLEERFPGQCARINGIIFQSLQNFRTLGIDVIAQESGIHTRIGGHLLFIQRLDELQGHVGRVAEFLVAFYLKGSQVEQAGRSFRTFLGTDFGHGEVYVPDAFQQIFSRLFVGNLRNASVGIGLCLFLGRRILFFLLGFFRQFLVTFAYDGREDCIPVDRLQFPILLGYEMFDFLLSFHNQGQGRCLYPPDGKYLFVLSVFQGIESGGIHAQSPVADGPAQPGFVERLELRLVFQVCKTVADGLFRQ